MANIKIIDLPTGSPESDSFLEATQVNEQAESGRSSAKVAFNAFGNWMAGQGQSPLQYNGLNTDSDTLIGAINELLVYVLNIADEYDPTATYNVGDYCIYQGVLYKCTTAIAVAEAWNSAHWTSTLIVDEFGTGGGASVTLGTTAPSDASGENGDLYVQYDSSTYAVVEYFVKINNSWRKSPYSRVVALTQAEYAQITPDPTTLYIITDAQSSYLMKSGGDITGTLTYKTDIDPSTAPSANKGFYIVALDDDNDNQLFRLETYQNSVNYIRGQMVVSRKVGNDTILNYFNMGIRPDGTKDVGVSDPDKWRSALGVPQKLKIGTDVRNFTDGVIYIPLSTYGLSSKPDCILLTPSRGDVIMCYDWDASNATNGLKITCRKTNDLTGITGIVRFSIAILA